MASAFKVFLQQSSFPFWKEYSCKYTPNLPIAIGQSATFVEHRKNKSRRRQGALGSKPKGKDKNSEQDAQIRTYGLHTAKIPTQGKL